MLTEYFVLSVSTTLYHDQDKVTTSLQPKSSSDKECLTSGNGIFCQGECMCMPGFSGTNCERDTCDDLDKCSGRGVCKQNRCLSYDARLERNPAKESRKE